MRKAMHPRRCGPLCTCEQPTRLRAGRQPRYRTRASTHRAEPRCSESIARRQCVKANVSLCAYARVRVSCAGVPMFVQPDVHIRISQPRALLARESTAQAVPMSVKMASRANLLDQPSESRCQGAIAVPPQPVSRERQRHFRSHPLRRHAGAAGRCSRTGAQRYDPSGSEFRASGSPYDPPPASGPLWSVPRREAQVPAAIRPGQPGARFGSPSSAPTDRKFGAQTSKCGVIANEQGPGSRLGRVQKLPRNGSLGLSEGTPGHIGDALTMTSRIGNPGRLPDGRI